MGRVLKCCLFVLKYILWGCSKGLFVVKYLIIKIEIYICEIIIGGDTNDKLYLKQKEDYRKRSIQVAISSNSKSGNPGGVHTTLNVNYDEAKERFGYPIEECSRSDFLRYKVGIVSQNGNIDSKEAFCWDLTYEFTNGYIYIQDQDRSAGKLANPGIEQYEYKDRIFVTEDSYDDEYIRIGYYPTDMGGLAYCATFNKSVDMYEVMDLIIEVELLYYCGTNQMMSCL